MNLMRTRKTRLTQLRSGAVTVEVAVCIPVLIVLLFACYEFANVNMVIHATESSAYEATRVAIVPGATEAQARTAAQTVLNSVGVRDFTMRVTPNPINVASDTVKVEIIVPFQQNSIVFKLFVDNPTFRGVCELSREQF